MGLAPSENPENLRKSVVAKVPVLISSQPRSEEWQNRQAKDVGWWHTLCQMPFTSNLPGTGFVTTRGRVMKCVLLGSQ